MSFAPEDIHLALNYFALFLTLFRNTFSMDESSGFFTALLRFKGLQSSFFSMLLLSLSMWRNAMNVNTISRIVLGQRLIFLFTFVSMHNVDILFFCCNQEWAFLRVRPTKKAYLKDAKIVPTGWKIMIHIARENYLGQCHIFAGSQEILFYAFFVCVVCAYAYLLVHVSDRVCVFVCVFVTERVERVRPIRISLDILLYTWEPAVPNYRSKMYTWQWRARP